MDNRPQEYRGYLNPDVADDTVPPSTLHNLRQRRNSDNDDMQINASSESSETSQNTSDDVHYGGMDITPSISAHSSISQTSERTVGSQNADVYNVVMDTVSSASDDSSISQDNDFNEPLYNALFDNDSSSGTEECYIAEDEQSDNILQRLKNIMGTEDFFTTIDMKIGASKVDIAMMILKYSITNHLSRNAIAALFQLINNIFVAPILLNTSYMVDELFNCQKGITLHAICTECHSYMGVIQRDVLSMTCPICERNVTLNKGNCKDFFVTLDPSCEIKNLIERHDAYYNHIVNDRICENGVYKDIYDGEMYKNFVSSLNEENRKQYATVIFNSDGSPVFESSTLSIWPVQIMINELPINIRMNNLILCGLWFGKNKPNMTTFLHPFVDEMNKLSTVGIQCKILGEVRNVNVHSICCCVDSAARAPIQGLRQFDGRFGCNWCLHPGEWSQEHKTMKYPVLDEIPEERTEEKSSQDIEVAVRTKEPVNGFKSASVLLTLISFNIISGFTVDYMHNILLGVARQFANYWIALRKKPYTLKHEQISTIDKMLINIKPHSQGSRLSRVLKDRKYWKTREWENWILYYSIPLLGEFLPKKYLLHWIKLVEALYILLKDSITINEIDHADKLLFEFIIDAEILYGKMAMTYNVHQLSHLGKCVLNWGPLWSHSGFAFENGNGKILRTIHAAKGIHAQICRYISLEKSVEYIQADDHYLNRSQHFDTFIKKMEMRVTKKTLKLFNIRYLGAPHVVDTSIIENSQLSETETIAYKRIIKEKCVYSTARKVNKRSDNSFAVLMNGTFIQCQEFIVDTQNNKELTVAKIVDTNNAFNVHENLKKIVAVSDDVMVVESSDISKPCMVIEVKNDKFICAVPNYCHY